MNALVLPEPELEFGANGRHIDVRYGLMEFGVLDRFAPSAPRRLLLGAVGTPETVEGFLAWIERCREGIPAKATELETLFPHFPGFQADHTFHCTLVIDDSLQRRIPKRVLDLLATSSDLNYLVESAVENVLAEVYHLAETASPSVIVCAMPQDLKERISKLRAEALRKGQILLDFHDLLKARSLPLRIPLQFIWQSTFDPEVLKKINRQGKEIPRPLQDEATRAWNLHAALYYKAGGLPYRLPRDASDLDTCYVGVSFYKSLDQEQILTSVAQVFNQRGEGVIVRGGRADLSKRDKQIHLREGDAYILLYDALETYRREHKNLPARVVVHKTSSFNDDELSGFNAALAAQRVETADLVSVRNSMLRLYRYGNNPPLRGTLLLLDSQTHVLYTRGSIPFYRTYPGMYVPRTLRIECDQTEQTPVFLAREVLALTKLNYNDTQLDGAAPMTVRAAQRVGDILKQVPDSELPPANFKFYM